MLKAIFKARNNLNFEIEAKEQKDVFAQIAGIQDVFSETTCQLCGKDDIKFVVRTVEDDEYYELQCNTPKCGGRLAFSQNKKGGTIYPVRKLKYGLPAKVDDVEPFDWDKKGWHRFSKDIAAKAKAQREKK